MEDLEKAIQILNEENCSFVLVNGEKIIKNFEKGLNSLIELINLQEDFSDFCLADKVCGRASSFLYVMLGVKSVYAKTMTNLAPQILDRAQIQYKAQVFVEKLLDSTTQKLDKMEEAVLRSGSAIKAFDDIKNALSKNA